MKISNVAIQNFRAIESLEIDLDRQTILIGENGVGKSCVIKAIDRFFSKSPATTSADFHNGHTDDPIDITLTFSEFSKEEVETFGARIHSGKMTVTRRLVYGSPPRENGKYFGRTPRHEAFQKVRSIEGAVPRRQAYNDLSKQESYADLQPATNDEQVRTGMLEWEQAHPEHCELGEDDGQFFGFANVGRGLLQRYISFVFIPAVRDASSDAADKGGSVAHQIIELLVKTVVEQRADFKKWKMEAEKTYSELVDPSNMGELDDLSGELSGTLQSYYGDTAIDLQWQPAGEFQASLPAAEVLLTEKGHTGPVEGKGHGLQRAFIFTLLQHLARALMAQTATADDQGQDTELQEGPESHTLILAIEEPELYQHPTKQRHFAKVLSELATGVLPGVIESNQVLVCSHSPYFISMDRFSEIRLARRGVTEDGATPLVVSSVSPSAVCDHINERLGLEGKGVYTPDILSSRLHILDPLVAEGFFAAAAVIVEGVGDRAALISVANAMKINLEALGIAVLPVSGKTNIARPFSVFDLFGIPTYAIFDCDAHLPEDQRHPEVNLGVQRLCDENEVEEFHSYIGDRYACFEENLEGVMKNELGQSLTGQLEKARYKYHINAKRVLKNPVALTEVIANCYNGGAKSPTLEKIIERVVSMVD